MVCDELWYEKILYIFIGAAVALAGAFLQDFLKSRKERKQRLRSLLAELRDNAALVNASPLPDGKAKIRLLSAMWELAKGDTITLCPDRHEALRAVYVEVSKYNSLIDYDLMDRGTGTFNEALELSRNTLREKLKAAAHIEAEL